MPLRLILICLVAIAGGAAADERAPELQAIVDRVENGAIALRGGGDPGTDIWFGRNTVLFAVRNVTQPRLTPVLPDPATATGAAVIVAPGGGNFFVAHGNEGVPVAEWLADHGIAAFLLTYRTVPTPPGTLGFAQSIAGASAAAALRGFDQPIPGEAAARDDMQAALRLVRTRARDWGVDPDRIGALGFSAGAIATLNTILADAPGARPAFAGLLYGRMVAVTPPPDAPPIFVAVAANDGIFARQGLGLTDSWVLSGHRAELHFYPRGGHGFGMKQQGTASDRWIEQFHDWLKTGGFLG